MLKELNTKKSVTLIEVMIVADIIALLAALAIPAYVDNINKSLYGG